MVSGSGWSGVRSGLPSGEPNSDLAPLLWRGLYPRAGIADELVRKSVSVSAGLEKRNLLIASLGYQIQPPDGATAEEIEQTRMVIEDYDALEGGFLESAIIRPLSAGIYGFSLSEIVLDVLESDPRRRWHLTGLHWMHPSTIKAWVLDGAGFPVRCLLSDERGARYIDWAKLYHTASGFYGRNLEGISDLRSLRYPVQHWSQVMVDDAIARERGASGILIAEAPPGTDRASNAEDYTYVEGLLQHILSGDEPVAVLPAGWKLKAEYLNAVPDPSDWCTYLDHLPARRLTDTVSELSASTQLGSRALAQVQTEESWAQYTGLMALHVHRLEYQVHRQIYRLNGWDQRRMCRVVRADSIGGEQPQESVDG